VNAGLAPGRLLREKEREMNASAWTAFRLSTGLILGLAPLVAVASADPLAATPRPGWARQETNLRLPGGRSIRAIHGRADQPVPTHRDTPRIAPRIEKKTVSPAELAGVSTAAPGASTGGTVSAAVIQAPPIDGFVGWVAVTATDKHKTSDEWDADPSDVILGNPLTAHPETSYAIGLLDTGAGVTVLGNASATSLGLFAAGYNSGGTIAVGGVTGSVDAWISDTFGLWMTGLGSINPSTRVLDMNGMVGTWNVSVAMGQTPAPGAPDLATAIGAPMAIYYASWIRNDTWHVINRGGVRYEGPDITFHDPASPALPDYSGSLQLQLRPTGAVDTWYWPCFAALEYCPGGDGSPKTPTVILGNSVQSLFFLSSVNLGEGVYTSSNKTNFMLDTGAQVTVISKAVASQLGLTAAKREFTVEIQGVDGTLSYEPGFYLDRLDIPALGEWLSYTKIPVVMLDVDSPEGGYLDGIIGMNLFVRYNLVLRGGGLPGMNAPTLDFRALPSFNFDFDYDGDVDMVDFAHMQACYTGENVDQLDAACSDAMFDNDFDVDSHEILMFAQCASGPGLPASPECRGQ
jgi:hypothetical protein